MFPAKCWKSPVGYKAMNHKTMWQAACAGAVLAFIAAVAQATAAFSLPSGVQAQPAVPVAVDVFVQASNLYPDITLGFFGADSLFVISYVVVFAGLYAATRERAGTLAVMGLAAGVLTAGLDATENAFYITYALGAKAGMPLEAPALPLIYLLTNLKWMAAFATLLAFGLVFPRETWLERIIMGLMLLFPLVGVLGVAAPGLIAIRGLFFLVGMPLFAVYFGKRARA